MRLLGGMKFVLYAEMDFDYSTLEPASAALLEFAGFLDFDHAQQSAVKAAGLVFVASGHGQLHVVDTAEWEIPHAPILSAGTIS